MNLDTQDIIMAIGGIFTATTTWVGYKIKNAPKQDEMAMNRINLIIKEYEKSLKRCHEQDDKKLEKIEDLKRENRDLRKEIRQIKGGDKRG